MRKDKKPAEVGEKRKGEEGGEEPKAKRISTSMTPNPSWGKEELKKHSPKVDPELRVQEVKTSDEEKMTKEEQRKETEARAAAGSSKDGPKKDPRKAKQE